MPRGTTEASVKDLNPYHLAAGFASKMTYNLILKKNCFSWDKGQAQLAFWHEISVNASHDKKIIAIILSFGYCQISKLRKTASVVYERM